MPTSTNVPVMTGAWAAKRFAPSTRGTSFPRCHRRGDRPVSRTIGTDQIAGRARPSLTHTVEMGGCFRAWREPASGWKSPFRYHSVRDGKLAHEHIYWDQASVLVQLGLLRPSGLPVTGPRRLPRKVLDHRLPSNELIGRHRAVGFDSSPCSARPLRRRGDLRDAGGASRACWLRARAGHRRVPAQLSPGRI